MTRRYLSRIRNLIGFLTFAIVAMVSVANAEPIPIAEVKRDKPVDYLQEIVPILQRNCIACHNQQDTQGGLVLETPESMRKGGDNGPALLPTRGTDSLMLKMASHNLEPVMPPSGNDVNAKPLTPDELGLLRLWIDQGAQGSAKALELSPKGMRPIPSRVTPVYSLDLTDDGQYLAVARGNRLFLAHVPTGRVVAALNDPATAVEGESPSSSPAHRDLIQSLAFNLEGDLLASGSFREVKLWRRPSDVKLVDVDSGSPITAMAVSPDRKALVTADAAGAIQFHDVASGKPGVKIAAHSAKVSSLRFAPDGRLVSASHDQTIRFWNASDGTPVGVIEAPAAVNAIEFTAALPAEGDAKPQASPLPWLVSAGAEPIVRVWTLPTESPTQVGPAADGVTRALFSPDQSVVAVAKADGTVHLLRRDDAGQYQMLAQVKAAAEAVASLALVELPSVIGDAASPKRQRLVTVAADGAVSIWDIESQALLATWRGDAGGPASIAASRDGKLLATGGKDGMIRLWSGESITAATIEVPLGQAPTAIATHPARTSIAVGTVADGAHVVKVIESETGKVTHTLTGHSAPIRGLAFSADGSRLVSGSEDKSIRVWNLGDAQKPQQHLIEGLAASASAVAFTPDGSQLLVATADHMIKLWNLADGMAVRDFAGHTGAILGVGYAAQIPFSVSADRSIRFWNTADGKQARAFNDQGTTVAWALSPDGNLLATAADDKQVRLYQMANGQVTQTLAGHSATPTSLAFTPDGKKLLSTAAIADRPSETFVWDLAQNPPRVQEVFLDSDVTASLLDAKNDRIWRVDRKGSLRRSPTRFVRYLEGQNQPIRAMAFSANGQTLFTAAQDGGFRGYQVANGQATFNTSHGAPITALAISSDDRTIVTAGENNVLRLWQANGNALGPQQIQGLTGPPQGLVISADQQRVIVGCGGDKPTMTAYDLTSGKPMQRFTGNAAAVLAMAARSEAADAAALATAPHHVVALSSDGMKRYGVHAVREITGHNGDVHSLAAMPAQPRQMWSGGNDGTIRLWNLDNGQAIRQFNHGGPVLAIAVRSDGQRVASASENKTAKLWQVNGQQVAELRGDLRAKSQVARATYQQTTATAMVNVSKQRLEAAEKDLPLKVEAEKKSTENLAMAEKTLAEKKEAVDKASAEKLAAEKEAIDAAAAARTALVAKTTAENSHKLAMTAAQVAQVQSSQITALANAAPSDQALKGAAEQAAMRLAMAQQTVQQMQAAIQAPSEAFTNATNVANTAAQKVSTLQKPFNDASAELVKATAARNLAQQQHEIVVRESKAAQDKVPVVKATFAEAEKSLEAAKQRLEAAQKGLTDSEMPVRSINFSPDGAVLLTGGDFQNVHAWDGETGTPITVYAGHTAGLSGVAVIDEDRFVSVSGDRTLKIWQRNPPWRLERTIGAIDRPDVISHRLLSLDFSPDSAQLLVAGGVPSRDGELQIFSVADGQLVKRFEDAHDDVIHAARFSPDGKRIATASADKYVRTFDAASGQLLRRFEGHTNYVLGVAWKGDSQTLVSCGADNAIKVWEAETADQKRTIDNNITKHVTRVEYIGETDTIISSSGDRGVRMHNAENGGNIRSFNNAKSWLHSVDISADGSVVAAGGEDGNVLVWNGQNGQLRLTLDIAPDGSITEPAKQ